MIKPRIKICGLTRSEDAGLAAELGAWALGFIFHQKSPRATTPQKVREVLEDLKNLQKRPMKTVGVFVNASIEEIQRTVETAGINTVQLHGDEDADFCHGLKKALPETQLIKALRLKGHDDLPSLKNYAGHCEAILLDTYSPGAFGGTGETGNWDWAREAKSYAPIILAGGLSPSNVRAAIDQVAPFALDASSQLEDAPGIKSAKKLREFFVEAGGARNALKESQMK